MTLSKLRWALSHRWFSEFSSGSKPTSGSRIGAPEYERGLELMALEQLSVPVARALIYNLESSHLYLLLHPVFLLMDSTSSRNDGLENSC